MGHQYFNAEVINIIDESDIVKRYLLRADNPDFNFKAGQFVMFDLPITSKFTNRSYSISSPPNNNQEFEVCIVLKEDGSGTPYLFQNVEIGSVIKTAGPFGKFILPDSIETDLCFLCTGTGIAPLRSMILDIYNRQIKHQNIYLIFGNRYKKDILYHDEFTRLSEQYPDFKFIPVLSRENSESWNGEIGYVHPIYLNLYSQIQKVTFYICGWSEMVREARNNLKEIGYTKNEIKFELYD